jgi:C_GCAxxG_C_C family probable redox protein
LDDIGLRMFRLSNAGYCCAQIMMKMALDEEEKENDDLIRALNGLCMGIGNSQKTCGVLTGGIAVLSLYAGKGSEKEYSRPGYSDMVDEFTEWFETEFNSTQCADLIGVCSMKDYLTRQEYRMKCGDMLVKSYGKVREILREHDLRLESGEAD